MTTPDEVIAELRPILEEYGEDERRVILFLAKRLLLGQRQYGKIDLARDPRDWRAQRAEEFADSTIYTAFEEIAVIARRGG